MNNERHPHMIHSDPPIFEYPCVVYVQSLLYNTDPKIENENVPLEKFVEFIATELEITKSSFWCYEKYLFIKLAFFIEEFLIEHADGIRRKNKIALEESVALLRFMSEEKNNIECLPNGCDENDPRVFEVRADIWLRVKKKFSNPNIKCPSCGNEFSQVAFDVSRTMYAVKCPKCNQSISC